MKNKKIKTENNFFKLSILFFITFSCVFVIYYIFNSSYLSSFFVNDYIKNEGIIKTLKSDIKVEIADTEKERERGLSFKKNINDGEGMFFIFKEKGNYPFWMKDMNFPIDIIWIGEDLRVVYIEKNAKPESYPESFIPTADSKYVLEIVSGFSEKNNLKAGDKVEFLSI